MPGFGRKLLKSVASVFGAIAHARRGGATVDQIVQETGLGTGGAVVESIGAVISAEDSIINAIDAVNSAANSDAITSEMVAIPVWAPEGTVVTASGPFTVRIPYTNPGAKKGTISGWVSQQWDALPSTKAQLIQTAQDALDESTSPEPTATLAPGVHILQY